MLLAGVALEGAALAQSQNKPGYVGLETRDAEANSVRVVKVLPRMPAEQAGLRPGDALTDLNGERITDAESFTESIRAMNAGDKATVKFARDGQVNTATIIVGGMPPALAAAQRGDWDGAIASYSEEIRLDPQSSAAYIGRAAARARKDDLDGAIADYTKAIRVNPNEAEGYLWRGAIKSDRKKDWKGAIVDYTEAIRLNPEGAAGYCFRGIAKANKGDRKGAVADYTEAIRRDPSYLKAYQGRAQARGQMGDKQGEEEDWAACRRLKEAAIAAQQAKFQTGLAKATLSELITATDKTDDQARERNRAIVTAKNQQLPTLLRDSKTSDLTALVIKIEQTILDLNHESELTKDHAQQVATDGRGRQLDGIRGLGISYNERIELLKPIAAALKEEIANRNR
jgi:tetratricopeptide (TPR) repeat protein